LVQMSKPDKDEVAQALVRKRWDKTPAAARRQIAKDLAAARWAGHVAKRPASSRKPAKKKATAAKKGK
jgi:hypothetical protein